MVRLKTRAGVKSPVEVSGGHSQDAEDEGPNMPWPAIWWGGHYRPGLFRRRPAPGHQGRRPSGWDQRPAAPQRTDRGSHRLRPGQRRRGVYAVFDLGAELSISPSWKLTKGVFEVMATGGDSALGGDDFDHRICCWAIEQAGLQPLSRATPGCS